MKLEEILNKPEFDKADIIYLLEQSDFRNVRRLFEKADQVRTQYCGDDILLRGIIEISNHCEQDCFYCALRSGNENISRYRMKPDEVIEVARQISNIGINSILLQSGEDYAFDADQISYIIYSIKQNSDAAVILSIGERDFEEYRTWRYAGADKYLIKFQTSSSQLFTEYHHSKTLEHRLKHIRFLKSIGYNVGSGNIIGLPHQTIEDVADDLLLCKELNLDMVSFTPFIPSPNTPLRNHRVGSVELTLKAIAICRIMLKDVKIPANSAIASIDQLGREKALRVGANIVMPDFTPKVYRDKYCRYPNKRLVIEEADSNNKYIQQIINSLGKRTLPDRVTL